MAILMYFLMIFFQNAYSFVYVGVNYLNTNIFDDKCLNYGKDRKSVIVGECNRNLILTIVYSNYGEIKDYRTKKCLKYDFNTKSLKLFESDCDIFEIQQNHIFLNIKKDRYLLKVNKNDNLVFDKNDSFVSKKEFNDFLVIPVPRTIEQKYEGNKNELYIKFNYKFAFEVNKKWKGLKAVVSGSNSDTIEKDMNFELHFDTSKINFNGYVKLKFYYPVEKITSSSLFLQLVDNLQSCPDPLVLEKKLCTNCPSLTYKNTVTGKCGLCDTSKNLLKLDNTCFQCEGNSYLNTDDDTCKKCAANQKADLVNKVCTNCPKGEVFDISLNDCTKCASDRIATDKGCEQCTSGKVPFEGRICVECKSNQIIVNSTCVDCGNGMIPDKKNNTCVLNKSCTVGKFWDKSKNKCVACGDGEISSDSKCVKCAAGEFADKVKNQCVKCSPGTESSNGVVCKPCKEGYYSKDGVSCKRCASGTNSNKEKTKCVFCKPGFGYQNGVCVKCPPGKYSNGNSACIDCSDGKIPSEDQTSCTWCIAGFEPSGGVCTKCQSGKYSTGSSVCLSCTNKKIPNDKQTECVCPPGKGIRDVSSDCEFCMTNYISFESLTCEKCPKNSSPNVLQTTCSCVKNHVFINKTCVKCTGSTVASSFGNKCEKVNFSISTYIYMIILLVSFFIFVGILILSIFLLQKWRREIDELEKEIKSSEMISSGNSVFIDDPNIVVDEKSSGLII